MLVEPHFTPRHPDSKALTLCPNFPCGAAQSRGQSVISTGKVWIGTGQGMGSGGEIGTGWEGQASVPLPTSFLSLCGPFPVHRSPESSGPSLASEVSLWQNHSRGPAQTPGKTGLALGGCLIIMFLFPKLFPGTPSETGSGRPMHEQTHVRGG